MSRAIKFRAWCKAEAKMWWTKPDIDIWDLLNEEFWPGLREEDLVLMQYTGLKDKNGVDIYEGDIVRLWDKTWRVEFGTGSFNIYAITGTSSEPLYETFADDDSEVEVIGNIYENPELLKEAS